MKEFFDALFSMSVTVGQIELKPFDLALKVVLPVIGMYILYRVVLALFRRLFFKKWKLKKQTGKRMERLVKILLRIAVLTGVVMIVGRYIGPDIPNYLTVLWNALREPLIASGSMQISLFTIILFIPVLYGGWWLSKRVIKLIDARLLSRMSLEKSVRFSIVSLARYILLVILLIVGLSLVGIDLSTLAVMLGALGIGIGFGLQNVVANFFAGLVIVFERPIKVGDRILVQGLEGDVIRIRLRSTVINTLTNETIVVPNSQLVENYIHNYSFDSPEVIIINQVQVAYESDLRRVVEVMLEVGSRNPFLLEDRERKVRVKSFDDSGITMELRIWIRGAQFKLEALAWNNMEIWDAFRTHHITIPFPQVDVHMKGSPIPTSTVDSK